MSRDGLQKAARVALTRDIMILGGALMVVTGVWAIDWRAGLICGGGMSLLTGLVSLARAS